MKRISMVALALSYVGFQSCSPITSTGSLADSPSYAVESGLAIVSSIASESESTTFGSAALSQDPNRVGTQAVACGSFNPRSSCNSSNQITVDWQDCFFPIGTGYMKGGWVSTYNNTAACVQGQSGALRSGESVTRTSNGLTIEGYYGGALSFDTNPHSTYNTVTIPPSGYASGVTVSNSGSARSISIGGAHRVLKDKDGTILFDVSMTTPQALLMTGTRASGNRQLLNSGSLVTYNNIEQWRGSSVFENVRWNVNSCCYPTSGRIVTSYDGSKSGYSYLTFNSTCGSATFVDTTGSTTNVTLVQCE